MAIDQDTLLRTLLADRAKVIAFIRSIVRRRELAEDVFQDVCVLALEKRAGIADEQHLAAWLRTTARFCALNVLRKKQTRQLTLDAAVLDALEEQWRRQDRVESPALSEALARCLSKLTDKARALVDARYGQGLTVAEVAERANRPAASVYVTLSRIHSSLADCVYRAAGGPQPRRG